MAQQNEQRDKPKYVKISQINGGFSFEHWEPCEEQFRSLIKNVEMRSHHTRDLFKLIKENCHKELRSLEVSGEEDIHELRLDGCETIAEQLSNVEMLTLRDVPPNNLDSYCVNLRKLFLIINTTRHENPLNQVWPKLELFSYYAVDQVDMNDFFRNHPHLQNVFCFQKFAIESLCSTEIDLSHVAVHLIDVDDDDDLDFLNNLERLCIQEKIKSLDISIETLNGLSDDTLCQYLRLSALKSIHFHNNILLNIPTDRMYPNIQMLCIDSFLSINEIQNCLKCLPNIKVLRVNHKWEGRLTEILIWIIANIPSLQHIFMNAGLNASFDMKKLNDERAKLSNAKTVKVHLPRSGIQLDPIHWNHGFISIVPSTENISCPVFVDWEFQESIVEYASFMNSITQ